MNTQKEKFTWQGLFSLLMKVETNDPTLKRKGELLALFIGLCWGMLVYVTLNNLIILLIDPTEEYRIFMWQNLTAFIPLHIFWVMNRRGYIVLTARLAILFSILGGLFFSDSRFIEYLMVVFALPVGMSSFILRPSSSFWYAGLVAAGYTGTSIWEGYVWEYNLTAIIALFALAFMTWATAHLLEQAQRDKDKLLDDLQHSNLEMYAAYETTLEGWSRALEFRDRETVGHTLRVTDLAVRISRRMGFSEDDLVHIRRGALLHDMGKLGIPDEILRKPEPLTDSEMQIMRLHPQIAVDLLTPIAYLQPALTIPKYHHEKWDGSGYPYGLKGEEIPLEARIFAIIDVYDALSYKRPYREAWAKEKVLDYIKKEAGKHFDPRLVEEFLKEVSSEESTGIQ